MAKKKVNYKPGDIFSIKISNGQYVFGRLLMDIRKQCVEPGLVESNSTLDLLECLIVEGYSLLKNEPFFEEAQVIINGYAIEDSAFHNGHFQIVGFKKVDPREIDFPEAIDISPFGGKVSFTKGEVKIPLNITQDEAIKFDVRGGGVHFSTAFESVILTVMGRTDLTQHPAAMSKSDVRFCPKEKRKEIYGLAGVDESISYYNMALKHGFDTARFFK